MKIYSTLKIKKNNLLNEGRSFSKRINQRLKKGFVPDLQNLKVCNYFYKSFWRHPDFAKLYVGEMAKFYVNFFKKNLHKNAKILDLGCGPGYFSLELARAGFDVVGIDISKGAIASAKKTLYDLKKKKNLKIKYYCLDLKKLNFKKEFDGILCSGFLHHIKNIKNISKLMHDSMKKNGALLIYEPQHKEWKKFDAFLVLFLRQIFKQLNIWYDKKVQVPHNLEDFNYQLSQIKNEFYHERDPNERAGQSPNDLSSDKDKILKGLRKNFKLIEIRPGFSFIYRFLGGLRGNQKKIKALSKLLASLEKFGLISGILSANYFYATYKRKK